MSGFTKEQLKNELISHGVALPSPNAKKLEYRRLYEKYVAPVEQYKGDFSSDDEDLPINDIKVQASSETSMIIDGLDISRLDDDELYSRLKDLGAEVGPIVDSTRKVYEKKLFVMMGGDMVESFTYNGDVDDEYSGSEEEVVVEKPTISRSSFMSESTRFTTTSSSPSKHTDLRKRIMSPASETKSSDVYDPERHTPSPRPSLRTVTSTSSETYTVRKFVNNGRSGYASEGTATKSAGDKTSSSPLCKTSALVRILVKLLFLALIIAIGLYIYQTIYGSRMTPVSLPSKLWSS
ncbi:hypothetical protein OTU49_006604 [Cherax quadricarinatus]|uniref:LEM domain-containing protein n=1 Tax=Cherax quadricarinatus TaxID=27406 RepID=A0AAW0X0Y5_CHEQU